jgi:hypothetical protein
VQTVNVDFIWCSFFVSSHKSRDFDQHISIILLKSIILSVLDAVIRRRSSKQANSHSWWTLNPVSLEASKKMKFQIV